MLEVGVRGPGLARFDAERAVADVRSCGRLPRHRRPGRHRDGEREGRSRARHGDDSVGLYFGNPPSFSIPATLFINGFAQGLNVGLHHVTGNR